MRLAGIAILATILLLPWAVLAAMTSSHYSIYADSIDTGGIFSASTTYSMQSTIGESPVGVASSSSGYEIRGGYQAMEQGYLSFESGASSFSLGELSTSTVSAASTTITISTDSATGYSLSIASAAMTTGTALTAIATPTFVPGVESYGMVTSTVGGSEGSAFPIADSSLIYTVSGALTNSQTVVTVKAAISEATTPGTRAQIITLQAVANF
ncbi:MAG: hypothetical protein WCT40_04920 [Candidatus Magasanikbacteria bacterium]